MMIKKGGLVLLSMLAPGLGVAAPEALEIASVSDSGAHQQYVARNAIDGEISDESRWIGEPDSDGRIFLELKLAKKQKLGGVHLHSGFGSSDPVEDFYFEFRDDSESWTRIPSSFIEGNSSVAVRMPFDATLDVETDALRMVVTKTKDDLARIKEIVVWPFDGGGIPPIAAKDGGEVPLIYLNQSGFNVGKPKRFSAPTVADGTSFKVLNARTREAVYEGTITSNAGDFSPLNPSEEDEFIVRSGGHESFPFRIGHWWLERVTYENAVRFMVESRHYFGNHKKKCRGSFGWRDDHHFNWCLTTLVPQYLSNPSAYERMPKTISYEQKEGFNGALEPFDENAPDIVKLIHHGADVIVTQGLKHELLKQQLAFFLYAWPWLEDYLPEQNYKVVSEYAFGCWDEENKDRGYPYDTSENHNLLELKTKVGTTKGENPPGHSIQPNLMMHEVAKRENRSDAEAYFQAAYKQVEWMISDLDWEDPQTTKGQRMSEHVTMVGLAMMLTQYPDRAPVGLEKKIEEWKQVVISRSGNFWDFRALSDNQWTPTGDKPTHWNEPGNVLGFPAVALAAVDAVPDSEQNDRLIELAYAHLDNAFGRNPTGRHFSYDAPREIEGCDLGWYSYYRGGIGQLADTHFVFDGAPKNEHYLYNPEVGNVGWTEGWIQFNTAFNLSLAYMAYYDTELFATRVGDLVKVRLKAPLNFDYASVENATVQVTRDGQTENLVLKEDGPNAAWFVGDLPYSPTISEVAYGCGYLSRSCKVE